MKKVLMLLLAALFVISCSQEKGLKHPEWSKDAVIYEANIRQHTVEGTFAAFTERMDELKEMGIDIIWLMPIHPIGEKNRKGSLGSYYAVKDYKAVNPEFGTEADFRALVNKAHEMGMYVIIDWVANHTAWDNVWTESHPEYYMKDSAGAFILPDPGWQDVIDLNYDNKALWAAMTDALEYWVRDFDIDGYRCDVAAMVPTAFWDQARAKLDKIKPVFMLAEASEPELHVNAFDMTYNWQLKDILNDIAAGKKNVSDIHRHFISEDTLYENNWYRMNFVTNHDENSWHKDIHSRLGDFAEISTVMTCLVEGMPLVYSGQEAGLDKSLRFFDKDTIEWKDHKFRSLFTELFKLKAKNKALWNGDYGGILKYYPVNDNVLVFSRHNKGDRIVALMNFSSVEESFELNIKELQGKYKNLFSGENFTFGYKQKFDLKPFEYIVLEMD